MTVTVKGADRLAASTAAAGRDLAQLPASVHLQAAAAVAEPARRAAPRRTGTLARSIVTRPAAGGAVVTAQARYARFVAGGSRHNPRPVPFMDIGLAAGQDAAVAVYADAADRILSTIRGA